MNGIKWRGLVSFSILTLTTCGLASADQPAVVANEPACLREKQATAGSELPSRFAELRFILASHKCEGDRCYVIEDDANCGETKDAMKGDSALIAVELEGILQSDSAPPMATPSLGRSFSGLGRIPKPTPATSVEANMGQEITELRVQNAALVTRLEMTQAILELQTHYTGQILLLERENAKLLAQSAEWKVKNEVNEQLTAVLVERTELSGKLTAAHDWISSRTAYEASLPVHVMNPAANPNCEKTIASIQEDLANLRRQLHNRMPVPFAVSNTVSHEQPYVPIGSKPETSEEANSPCREAAAKGNEVRY